MHRLRGFIFLMLLLSLTSCEILNPTEDLPAYITVRNPIVLVDSSEAYYSPLGVKDAWVYQGENLLGTYKFGSTFPYINLEKTDFSLDGGIYETGLSGFRLPYPFWDRLQLNIVQQALDTLVIEPTFTYLDDDFINIAFEENFESLNHQFNPIQTEDTANFYRTSTISHRGNFCGTAVFSAGSQNMELVSDELPYIGRNVNIFCEVTYNTEIPFTVGLYWIDGLPVTVGEVVFSETNGEWKTVYVNMVSLIRNSPDDPLVQKGIWIKAFPDSANGSLYLDNIRLIHSK